MNPTCYSIKNWGSCGVGNKLLRYWNMVQKATQSGCQYSSYPDKDVDAIIKRSSTVDLNQEQFIAEFPVVLGETFFSEYTCPNRVCINNVFNVTPTDIKEPSHSISIHLRGGDFRMWKGGEGMLDLDYYCNAVDYIIDSEVCLSHCRNYEVITDDVNHPHLERLINYIKSKDLVPNTINDIRVNSIQVDWNRIRMGKWIISSPSTFAITAGMVSDARIIHSKKWVDARVSENDPFWVGLHRGGNKEYRAEVFI